MKEKIVLIGAGSAMFTRGLVGDLIRSGMEADLALVDIDPHAPGDCAAHDCQDDRRPAGAHPAFGCG